MTDLADYTVQSKLSGNPIARRTGDLVEAVLASVRVTSNDETVHGSIAAKPKKLPNEGIWQEFGTKHAAIANRLRVFAAPDGNIVFTRATKAFQIPARPFLNPSLHEEESQIIATIRARLTEAHLEAEGR
jgi:hypothetical protein